MDNPSTTLDRLSSAHANLTVFDLIATVCGDSIRGGSLTTETARAITKIQKIALQQRQAQFLIYDATEKELQAALSETEQP